MDPALTIGPNPQTAPPADQALPAVPGYQVQRELGRGGMGVVYQAVQLAAGRLVALKMLRDAEHADPRDLTRFRDEAQAAACLQHPNIVQIHEVGTVAGKPFFSL